MTWADKSLRRVHGWLLLGGMFFASGVQGAQAAGAAQGEGDSPVSAEEASVSSGPADMPARVPSLSSQIWGDHTDVSLSLLVGAGPSYMGSRDTQRAVGAFFGISRGIFFLDDRGIGVQYGSDDGLMASLSIGADPGRSEKKSSVAGRPGSERLKGMGTIRSATTANLALSVPVTDWLALTGAAEFRVHGAQRGNTFHAGFDVAALDTDSDQITVGLKAHGGNQRYNALFFGVTPQQAQTSRFSAFETKSGLHAYSLEAGWNHVLDRHWSITGGVEAMRMANRAAKSPIVEKRTGISGYVGVNYQF
jgi:mltA-interacting mipA